ncbi:MAG: DUF2285 domain-containing protein [Nitratireductor sp.]|nr:DUF2285 domain-containing protein [Nitratireductor sp.]
MNIFFAPGIDPGTLILTALPHFPESDLPSLFLPETDTFQAPEGHFLFIDIGRHRFPALCPGAQIPARPVAPITVPDRFLEDRLDAIRRFSHAINRRRSVEDLRVTPYRRNNLRQMLRVIDGRRSGATFQEIAEIVLRADHVSATAWKSMPERDTVMRRFREGMRFVEGSYRSLLYRHHPTI